MTSALRNAAGSTQAVASRSSGAAAIAEEKPSLSAREAPVEASTAALNAVLGARHEEVAHHTERAAALRRVGDAPVGRMVNGLAIRGFLRDLVGRRARRLGIGGREDDRAIGLRSRVQLVEEDRGTVPQPGSDVALVAQPDLLLGELLVDATRDCPADVGRAQELRQRAVDRILLGALGPHGRVRVDDRVRGNDRGWIGGARGSGAPAAAGAEDERGEGRQQSRNRGEGRAGVRSLDRDRLREVAGLVDVQPEGG